MEQWETLSSEAPIIGISNRAPDGAENTMVFKAGDHWNQLPESFPHSRLRSLQPCPNVYHLFTADEKLFTYSVVSCVVLRNPRYSEQQGR